MMNITLNLKLDSVLDLVKLDEKGKEERLIIENVIKTYCEVIDSLKIVSTMS